MNSVLVNKINSQPQTLVLKANSLTIAAMDLILIIRRVFLYLLHCQPISKMFLKPVKHLWCSFCPANTPRKFHMKTTWTRQFPRHFNVEYMWCICRVAVTYHRSKVTSQLLEMVDTPLNLLFLIQSIDIG